MEILKYINENFIWGAPMLAVFLLTGAFFTFKLRFRQFSLIRLFRSTLFAPHTHGDEKNLSPFQTLTAALATTLGTGNIVAVGAAVAAGGAGAVFWMILSAFLGMATCYAENYLGVKYRDKNGSEYTGGAFRYVERALRPTAGKVYAALCVIASLGMGNMTQMNAMSCAVENAFGVPPWISGIIGTAIVVFLICGGIKSFGKITEKLIPALSVIYILGCLIVILLNITSIPSVLCSIFSDAFNVRSASCGIFGSVMLRAMSWGIRRGVFSNEAGLGTSVMINCSTEEKDPSKQGQWAMLQVFFDTVVMCSLTALALLLTNACATGSDGTQYAVNAFGTVFGDFSGAFVALSLLFFALTTTAGWSIYGTRCAVYLFGDRIRILYLVIFAVCAFVGSVAKLETVWLIADLANGTMALPNLASLLALSGEVKKPK